MADTPAAPGTAIGNALSGIGAAFVSVLTVINSWQRVVTFLIACLTFLAYSDKLQFGGPQTCPNGQPGHPLSTLSTGQR